MRALYSDQHTMSIDDGKKWKFVGHVEKGAIMRAATVAGQSPATDMSAELVY